MHDSFNRLLEKFLSLQPAVQIVCGLVVLAMIISATVVVLIVAIHPTSAGDITSLITTTVLLVRGQGHPLPANVSPH